MSTPLANSEAGPSTPGPSRPLQLEEYERYGRQMILPGWGLPGQLKLKAARVAVVGAGGLGCPVLQYLAGAGLGTIDIFDHDTVSASNLHRQVLHTTDRVGTNKSDSAAIAMIALNPFSTPISHSEPITSSNALDLLRPAQIIVDCTDRPLTRYLLNDAAVRLGVPLVSGAAISSAGQWAVYGGVLNPNPRDEDTAIRESVLRPPNGLEGGKRGDKRACYRCMWPQVIPGSNGRCEDAGVWGMVTGMVGTGMASEVVKLIIGNEDDQPLLHLLHLNGSPLIRTIKLKPPSAKCIACGPDATITDDLDSVGYEEFCGGVEMDEESGMAFGMADQRINAEELYDRIQTPFKPVTIIDTRPHIEYEICSIPGSTNFSMTAVPLLAESLLRRQLPDTETEILLICKQGNDSQIVAANLRRELKKYGEGTEGKVIKVRDVRGGLRAWSKQVDPSFPLY